METLKNNLNRTEDQSIPKRKFYLDLEDFPRNFAMGMIAGLGASSPFLYHASNNPSQRWSVYTGIGLMTLGMLAGVVSNFRRRYD